MAPSKQPQILNASSNLIGICFVIIAGLKITNLADRTYADEVCIISAFAFMCACILSYISIRTSSKRADLYERLADYTFLASLLLLFMGITLFARDLL
jgi:hypothetical protein